MTLGLLSTLALGHLQRAVARRFGAGTSLVFVVVTACQFHLPYYMSRTLPNTFALILGTLLYRVGGAVPVVWCANIRGQGETSDVRLTEETSIFGGNVSDACLGLVSAGAIPALRVDAGVLLRGDPV